MNKLELNHLAPYFPYGLKVSSLHTLHARNGIGNISHIIKAVNEGKSQYKPILRPLSDLTKEIEHNGEKFCPYERFTDDVDNINDDTLYEFQADDGSFNVVDCKNLPMYAFNWLLSLHFDVFGLIEKGLAIDINTLYARV